MKPQISLLVTDLDNTLWDWFNIWYRAFTAMLDIIVAESGCNREELEDQIKAVHQLRRTSEYPHLIQELPALQERYPGEDLAVRFAHAIRAYQSERRAAMTLYPGVYESLNAIKRCGTTIVGYTESLAYVSSYRIRRFHLDGVIDTLYSPPDSDFPAGVTAEQLRVSEDPADYTLQRTQHRHTPVGLLKPEPEVLAAIVEEMSDGPQSVAYVGDSLMKDVSMAQRVGVADVYAKYGVANAAAEYELLRRVTHWSSEDVEREKEIAKRQSVEPTYVLRESFAELLEIFEFRRP
jgi:phosphoglycolate phosphatase-like HAD superfamily hydrolase